MKEAFRTVVFMALVIGLFTLAVQVLDWMIQEEKTYRANRDREGGPRYE